ncbi:MAG: hypothetical protein HC770_06105 [Pseudanabaena sp. CRU_2_10]|nr:hypothetical protein [Pseudanabaena sp. CRU_2_10]
MNLSSELAYQAYLSIYLIWHIRGYIAGRSQRNMNSKAIAQNPPHCRLKRDRSFSTKA